jgi:hypothetical protein
MTARNIQAGLKTGNDAPSKPALRGRWIAAAARRLFSPESFALLVEPAIADLQFEDSGRLAQRMDAYRTVWIGMAAACDHGVARRARTFVRDNELVTLTGLALLHGAHSLWMVVLLLGLDGRVQLGRVISSRLADLPSPGVLAAASVLALYGGRLLVLRLLANRATPGGSSIVRVLE